MIVLRQKYHTDFDVLIAGGGPAGSALAFHLSRAGIKTAVAEAGKFPRDKVCGDGVSPIAMRELQLLGITETPTFRQANEINEVGLYIKEDKAIVELHKPDDMPYHARIIPRMELDTLIYEAAKRAGATFFEQSRVVDYTISKEKVVTTIRNGKSNLNLSSGVIIGADGGRSLVARKLRGAKPDIAFQLLGLRAYYEGVNGPRNRVDIYFSEENFPGIYWAFPFGKAGANIGMAMVYKTYPQQASQVTRIFETHLRENTALKTRIGQGTLNGKIEGWPISIYDPRSPVVSDRLMLVGEAAGLINPLSGDGIQYALLSARWAADCLAGCFKRDDLSTGALSAFREKLEHEFSYDFAFSNLLVHFGRNKTMTPVWMAILSILISRSKADPQFAKVLAGVFEGTYPSYEALKPQFVSKVLLEGGLELGGYLGNAGRRPDHLFRDGSAALQFLADTAGEMARDPEMYRRWLVEIAQKSLTVSRHGLSKVFKLN